MDAEDGVTVVSDTESCEPPHEIKKGEHHAGWIFRSDLTQFFESQRFPQKPHLRILGFS